MLDLTPAGRRTLNLTMTGGSVSVASYLGAPGPQGLPGPGSAAWKAGETVTVGAVRQAPDGSWIKSTSNRTTGATFDTTEQGFWQALEADPTTVVGKALTASFTQKPTADLGDWALLRRDTSDVSKGVAWTTPSVAIAKLLGWTVAPEPTGADDQAVLQGLVNDPATKVLWLRAGTYLANLAAHPVTANYYCVLALRSGQRLAGPGRDQCAIKLLPSQTRGVPDGNSIITNRVQTGGDEGIEVVGIEVDGNAANQTLPHNGITFIRTRGASCLGVRVRNVKGTAAVPPNETFHFETQLGIDTTYVQCEAVGSGPTVDTASGFSADNCTGVTYVGCVGRGMRYGHGFTHYQTRNLSYVGCRAYSNGNIGFNSEESIDVSYSACHAGGEQAPGTTPYPNDAGTSLGNNIGFVINGTKNAHLTGCTSRRNTADGITLTPGSSGSSGVITNMTVKDNGGVGISLPNITDPRAWRIDPSVVVSGNTGGAYQMSAGLGGLQGGPRTPISPPPGVPASGTAVTNTWPWPMTIYIVGGAVTLVQIDGNNLDAATKTVRLEPGMAITVFYSTAPTWAWYGA